MLGTAYQIKPHARTPVAVVEALFRDPAETRMAQPRRPVPQHKRVCAVLPVVAAVTEAPAPPRPAEVVFPGWPKKPAAAILTTNTLVLLMDGQASLWDAAAETSGHRAAGGNSTCCTPPVICGRRCTLSRSRQRYGPEVDETAGLGLLSGMGTGVIRWLQHLAEQGPPAAAAPGWNRFTVISTATATAFITINPPPAIPSPPG